LLPSNHTGSVTVPTTEPSSGGATAPANTTAGTMTGHRADSAFLPQIDEQDLGPGPGPEPKSPTLVPNPMIEDRNQAPPDPFPFDLANYEIPPEEEPEQGHDEGIGTGLAPTQVLPGSGTIPAGSVEGSRSKVSPLVQADAGSGANPVQPIRAGTAEKTVEELQLASVLQFMSSETKKLLKSINATKGHVVHSYKTQRNKSQVHSLWSYHRLPGLYTKLSPYEEIKNETAEPKPE
ncbi:hypothetical protein PENTCL1PPCAC_25850, partial [Pristionchus entomophagus]